MPTRLLLEGGDLQELLAQVREEHGARAKIVSAERVRAGGLTGLLRSERYELTVELPDGNDGSADAQAVAAAPAARSASDTTVRATSKAGVPANRPADAGPPAVGPTGSGSAAAGPAVAGPAVAGSVGAGSPVAGAVPGGPAVLAAPGGSAIMPIEPTTPANPAQVAQVAQAASAVEAAQALLAGGPAGPGAQTGRPAAPTIAAAAAGNPSAVTGGTPRPANASRQPAQSRPVPPPATASDNGGSDHGPDVDELLTLLEQREQSTPDTSSVGGFDEVLAELRAGGAPAAQTGAAQIIPPPTTQNGTAQNSMAQNTVTQESAAAQLVADLAARNAAAQPGMTQPGTTQPGTTAQAQPPSVTPTRADPARRVTASPGSGLADETIEFSLDPIFAPASGDPAVSPSSPAPAGAGSISARAGVPAPAGTARTASQRGPAAPTVAGGATAARPAKARPLTPDPKRPNHFLTYPELDAAQDDRALPARLADLGLPARVLDRLPLGEAYPSIVRALQEEPVAPPLPTGPGMIITIIGELTGALAVAEDVARILRLDAGRILVASESPQVGRHIADPGDAGRQAVRLRGGDQPRLVCVDAPGPTSWVQQVVVALRPDAVWCAVDATRKPADVARQLRSLPRVDALAVHALEATADPASPLALGVPVALLDGQPAGPHGWAALLCRRMYEEEHTGGDS